MLSSCSAAENESLDYYGVNTNLNDEYLEYILSSAKNGVYDMHYITSSKEDAESYAKYLSTHFKDICATFDTLLGSFINLKYTCKTFYDKENNLYDVYLEQNFSGNISFEEIKSNQEKSIDLAKDISKNFKFKKNMTEKEKAEYILKIIQPSFNGNPLVVFDEDNLYTHAYYDSIYATLKDNNGYCTSKSASLNLILRLNGIKAYGCRCKVREYDERYYDSANHIVSIIKADGQIYFIDVFHDNLMTYSDLLEWAYIDNLAQYNFALSCLK